MSTLILRTLNENFILWPSVSQGGMYTPCAPADSSSKMSFFFYERKPGAASNQAISGYRAITGTPDDDIRSGRVHRFKTPKALLRGLKSRT